MERAPAAGGKVARRSFRKRAPATPYDRPPPAEPKQGGLVSKIFARAASSLFPSLFSSSSSEKDSGTSTSESLPISRDEVFDRVSSHDANNPAEIAEKSQPCADPSIDKLISEEARNDCDSGKIAEIELWLKQRTFSSELAKCLMGVLRSSTSGLCHDDPNTSGFGSEAEGTMKLKAPRKPSQCSVLSEQLTKTKPQDASLMKVVPDAGSSPAEIAKAYIKSLTTESYPDAHENGASSSKAVYPSVSKLPISWPGPSLESNHFTPKSRRVNEGQQIFQQTLESNHFTPKSRRVNEGQQIFQQTPYSRSIFARSKFNSGKERQKTLNVPLPIRERSSTSGSIMVQENYEGTTPKELGNSHLAIPSATKDVAKISSSTLRPTSKKDTLTHGWNPHIPEATENNICSSSVHPKSRENARKILEHLNITVPPKEEIVHLDLEKTETKAVNSPSSNLRVISEKDSLALSLNYRSATAKASASNLRSCSVHPNSEKYGQAAANPAMGIDPLPPFTSLRRKQSKLGAKSFDEGSSFTFPVTASSNASSEPSTPTLNSPSPAAGFGLPMPLGSDHAFSFGTNKARHLVFPVHQR